MGWGKPQGPSPLAQAWAERDQAVVLALRLDEVLAVERARADRLGAALGQLLVRRLTPAEVTDAWDALLELATDREATR